MREFLRLATMHAVQNAHPGREMSALVQISDDRLCGAMIGGFSNSRISTMGFEKVRRTTATDSVNTFRMKYDA